MLLLVPFQHIGCLGVEVYFSAFAFLFYCILLFFSVNGNGKEKKEVVVLWVRGIGFMNIIHKHQHCIENESN